MVLIGLAGAVLRYFGPWWALPLLLAGGPLVAGPDRRGRLIAAGIALALVGLTGLPAGGPQPWPLSAGLLAMSWAALRSGRRGGGGAGAGGQAWGLAGLGLGLAVAALICLAGVWLGYIPILPWLEVSFALGQGAVAFAAAPPLAARHRPDRRGAAALGLALLAYLPAVWLLFLAP